jgi:integrase
MPEKMLLDSQIKRARPRKKVYTLRDGGGLFVIVHPTGKKYFQLRYSYGKRQRLMQLGPWPRVTLEQARADVQKHRDALRLQRDPITTRRLGKLQKIRDTEGTFASIGTQWLERNKSAWSERNYQRQKRLLHRILLPQLGPLPIREIDTVAVLSVLREQEARGVLYTARQALQTAQAVFSFAISCGILQSNPARDLGDALQPRPEVNHHAAIKLDQVGPMLRALPESSTHPVTQAALRLVLLLGLRDNTLRSAQWKEVDLSAAVWVCPAQHMKGRRGRQKEFATPLPKQAVAVLKQLQPLTDRGPDSFVFAGSGKSGRMSKSTLCHALQRLGYDATAHGMRSLLTDFGYETGYRSEAIEAQLSHAWGAIARQRDEGNGQGSDEVRKAYLRSAFWEHRVALLQHWADTCTALEKSKPLPKIKSANVVRIRYAA